jgi:transposase InsO family protein
MALGRRCDNGCESWPDDERYERCPICRSKTTRYNNLRPLPQDEADAREFEAFYERYCEKKEQPVNGGLPMPPEQASYWDKMYPDGQVAESSS